MELYQYGYIAVGVFLVLAIVKTIHFLKNKNRNWRWSHWFYFSQFNICRSTNDERARLKRVQNTYSLVIFIFLAVTLIYLYITM